MNYIPLDQIVIDHERLRKDMGDIDGLAKSILAHSVDLVETRGLLHPIVLNSDNVLIAGGRRLAAFRTLCNSNKVFCEIPYTRVEQLTPAKRRMLEIEENHRRHQMTWQEDIIGICDFHRLAGKEALKDGERYTQEMTAEHFGVDQASISVALKLGKILRTTPDSPIAKAEHAFAALQLVAKAELDQAAKEQLRRIENRRTEAAKNIVLAKATVPIETINTSNLVLPAQRANEAVLTNEQIASFYYHGSCLTLLPEIAKTQRINHIMCDPPFGIDMDNIDSVKSDRVAGEHEVAANVNLLKDFLSVAYSCIAEDGFLVMWYDLDHHEKIKLWAEETGWKVCRWPLVWCKTSNCQNNQAIYNITKATEVCYFLRRSEKSFIKVKQPKNWICCDAVRDPLHPFVKPAQLWNYILDTISNEGETIVDPFAGQGSSLVQIFKRNRVPVGIELVETHIANGINYIADRIGTKNFPTTDVNELLSELPL